MIAPLIYFSGICGTKFSKKTEIFQKPRVSGLSTGLPPSRKAPARQDGGAGRQPPDDEIEPVSSPRRSARCRSRAILKSGEPYPRETKSRHAVKRDG